MIYLFLSCLCVCVCAAYIYYLSRSDERQKHKQELAKIDVGKQKILSDERTERYKIEHQSTPIVNPCSQEETWFIVEGCATPVRASEIQPYYNIVGISKGSYGEAEKKHRKTFY